MVQVKGPGKWRLDLGKEFRVIDNGDSIQAVAGDRVVYLSAMQISSGTRVPTAAEVRATASRSLRSSERMSHRGHAVEGEAEIRRDAESLSLHGVMCASGALATCVISFKAAEDAAWAESVWRSLNYAVA